MYTPDEMGAVVTEDGEIIEAEPAIAAQSRKQGSQAYISGKLSAQEYTDRDGNRRTSLEVRADDVQFLDRKPQGDSRPADELEGARQYHERKAAQRDWNGGNPGVGGDGDSSIPF